MIWPVWRRMTGKSLPYAVSQAPCRLQTLLQAFRSWHSVISRLHAIMFLGSLVATSLSRPMPYTLSRSSRGSITCTGLYTQERWIVGKNGKTAAGCFIRKDIREVNGRCVCPSWSCKLLFLPSRRRESATSSFSTCVAAKVVDCLQVHWKRSRWIQLVPLKRPCLSNILYAVVSLKTFV